ncbi:MAG: hypothetical protein GX811_05610, partial [Lentisphaerae bacterium]|nr:hypothetical protein [Lentisphaerota bacterium]
MRKDTFTTLALALAVFIAAVSFMVADTPAPESQETENTATIDEQEGATETTAETIEAETETLEEQEEETEQEEKLEEEPEVFVLLTEDKGITPGAIEETGENLISIDLGNVPINDMIKMFSSISGANIITAGEFTNTVTANLRDVEWRPAFELILGSVNLAIVEDPGSKILMVVTAEQHREKTLQMEAAKPLTTAIYTPTFLDAVDLVKQIKEMAILSPRGSIITSQSEAQTKVFLKSSSLSSDIIQNPSITTAIIVRDIEEYVKKVVDIAIQLD